jgi:N-acetylneuraminic acid mutarotase
MVAFPMLQRNFNVKFLFVVMAIPTILGRQETAHEDPLQVETVYEEGTLQALPWSPAASWSPKTALTQTSSNSGQAPLASGMWSWSRIQATGTKPMGREGHASVTVGQRIYYIGGCIQEIQCFNDVHIFDTMSLQWIQEAVTGDAPEPRGGHTATLVGTDIWVFGGASSETTYDSVHKLDLISKHWTRAAPTGGDASPAKRTNHAAAADAHGRVYIFGGYDAEGNFLNDIWILNVFWNGHWDNPNSIPVVWEHPIPTGQLPVARESHSLTLVLRKLVLFGGFTTDGHCANDVHVYDLDRQDWSGVPSAGDAAPAPRQAHSATRHGLHVIVAGGCDVGAAHPLCYNDVWSLDTIGMRWTQMSPDAISWFPREGHTANFVRGQMFVFGGCQLTALLQ